jgi:hypothetical protein
VLVVHGELAQAQERSQDVQVYAGYMFGDHLLEKPLSGSQLRVDDSAAFQLASHPLIPYTVIRVGHAWANLDHSMYGLADDSPVTISDSNSYTANAGLGVKYYLRDNNFLVLNARNRYLSRLVSDYGQGLSTAETTLSLAYRF